jgi:hypothetical protein
MSKWDWTDSTRPEAVRTSTGSDAFDTGYNYPTAHQSEIAP